MLVLSRKTGQRIFVGDEIVIEVARVSGSRVLIGVDAPDDMKILREEVKKDGQHQPD